MRNDCLTDLTLYRPLTVKDEFGSSCTIWKRYTLRGCVWKTMWKKRDVDHGYEDEAYVTCRVPEGEEIPQVGDWITPLPTEGPTPDGKALAIIVTEVWDNTRFGTRLSHWKACGRQPRSAKGGPAPTGCARDVRATLQEAEGDDDAD